MMTKKNSKFAYLVFHPEYLVDLLRAGGRFPIEQAFTIPSADAPQSEMEDFIERRFPSLSEERYEIWLKFKLSDDISVSQLSLEDIVSSHFYSNHRKEAASDGVLHALNVYGIPVLEPLDKDLEQIIEEYDAMIRHHTASLIVKAWFPDIKVSKEFFDQLKLGYKYQQSSAPEKLSPIPSQLIWAHLVAYNHGLRKFDERPDVLWLQDIQEVIKRTDANFKQQLKLIGSEFNSKFSDILDDAEQNKQNGITPSKWIIDAKKNGNPYFHEIDIFLSKLGKQCSFFYTALLYLNWRESVLNNDYTGKLSDHKEVSYFLSSTADNPMRGAIAEALFTIVYAGGPRVFQQALIEARMKILGMHDFRRLGVPQTDDDSIRKDSKPLVERLFSRLGKSLGKAFGKSYEESSKGKKKDIQKEIKNIGGNITKVKKGEFSYEQYVKLCALFDFPVQQFDDYPIVEGNSSSTIEGINEVEQNSSPESVLPVHRKDDPSSDLKCNPDDSDQVDEKEDTAGRRALPADAKDDLSNDAEGHDVDSDIADKKEGSAGTPQMLAEINDNPLIETGGEATDTDQAVEKEGSESDIPLDVDIKIPSEEHSEGLVRAEKKEDFIGAPTEPDDTKGTRSTDEGQVSDSDQVDGKDDFPSAPEAPSDRSNSKTDKHPTDTDHAGIKEDPENNPTLEDETINQSAEHSEGSVRAEKEEDSIGAPTEPDDTKGIRSTDEGQVFDSDQVDAKDDSPSAPEAPVDSNNRGTDGHPKDIDQEKIKEDSWSNPVAPADVNDYPSSDILGHADFIQKTELEEKPLEINQKENEVSNATKSIRMKRGNHSSKKLGISKATPNQGDLFGDSE